MKFKKRLLALITTLAVVLHFIGVTAIQAFAHEAMLDVNYDDCIGDIDDDGINEMWYFLENGSYCVHIGHETDTITYRFVDDPAAGYSWTPSGESSAVGDEIKAAYAASMQKWNNVYFYSYNTDGTITKNKLINIIEITQGDANITIYPATSDELEGNVALTSPIGSVLLIENDTITHIHAPTWRMDVNIDVFYEDSPTASLVGLSNMDINLIKSRTGAHEIGHVLGLMDIDYENICNAEESEWHHHELLMGYGTPVNQRSDNITYKDIAGVAITRGFHTESDHKWLYIGLDSNGKHKFICSICNGVNFADSLSGYTYNTYNACGGNHTLPSGNMMAVASYGTSDYYKCKYCRYVAPFDNIEAQNYSISPYSDDYHIYTNNVDGLNYVVKEAHSSPNGTCTVCGRTHSHSYTRYTYIDTSLHRATCSCGYTVTEAHYVRRADIIDNRYAKCVGCKRLLDLNQGHVSIIMGNNMLVSANGSYILSNGIVVLVDEDIQAYLDGTLIFYNANSDDNESR
ncbi:MAG: hypothetical protein IJW02_01030 [Clostridia bacterium]|nr:hypothetical protein [Clostridia bacterium]